MRFPLAVLATLTSACTLAEPRPLDNDELAAISGGEGISMALELSLNADAAGSPRSGTSSQQRRFALKFDQEWLVFHDISGGLVADEIQFDLELFGGKPALKASFPGQVHLNKIRLNGIFISPDSQNGGDPNFGPNPANTVNPHQSVFGYYGDLALQIYGGLYVFPHAVSASVYNTYRFDN